MEHSPDQRTSLRRWAAVIGAFGMAIATVADFYSLYSPVPAARMPTMLTLSLRDFVPLLVAKPAGHLLAGHVLALLGLSIGLAGVWAITPELRRRFPRAGRVTAGGAAVAYLLGVAWHTSLGCLGTVLSGVSDPAVQQEILARMGPLALTSTGLFYGLGLGIFALLFVQLLHGCGSLPHWMAWVSPLPVHVVGFLLAAVLPSVVGAALQYSVSNLSLVLFYALAAPQLRPNPPRSL